MGNLFAKNDTEIDIPEEELEELRMYTTFHVKEIGRLHIEFLRMTKGTGWLTKEAFLRIPCIEANPLRDRICLCFGYSEDDIIVKPPDDRNRNESEHDGSIENSDEDVDECADNINNAHENKNIKKVKHSVESSKSRVDVKNSRGIEDNNALRIGSEATTDSGIDGDADSNKSPAIGAFNKEIEEEDGSKLNFRKFLIGISLFNSYGRLEEKLKLAFRLQDFDNDDIISREDMTEYLTRMTGGPKESTKEDIDDVVEELFLEVSSDPRKLKITFLDFQIVLATAEFQTKLRLPI